MVGTVGGGVTLLGLGEALHGGEEILRLRNRVFQELVARHGFSAIAIESSHCRARRVNDFVQGRGALTYEQVATEGFGHGMGKLEANRELVEWMRAENAGRAPASRIRFYGFDIPTGSMGGASPRGVLRFVTDYLAGIDPGAGKRFETRFAEVLGEDAGWENPAVYMDPSQSIALTPAAATLRVEIENLIAELRARRPALVADGGADAFLEALHEARTARELLNFHVAMAVRKPGQSPAIVLGARDASMADTLLHIADCERGRGTVLVFAHNSHLQRGEAVWPGQNYWGTEDPCRWWPAGAHLAEILGPRYAVLATAVGVSPDNGIAEPEPGTIEARLAETGNPVAFVSASEVTGISRAVRSGSVRNPTYVPLDERAGSRFDGIVFLREVTYNRGGPPLSNWEQASTTTNGDEGESAVVGG